MFEVGVSLQGQVWTNIEESVEDSLNVHLSDNVSVVVWDELQSVVEDIIDPIIRMLTWRMWDPDFVDDEDE